MDQNEAKRSKDPKDAFQALAAGRHEDVARIRERNRRRRLRYILYLNLIVFAFLLRRALDDRPIEFGLPSFGPDAALWLFPVAMLVIIALAVLGPLLVSGRSPGIRFSPEQIGIGFDDVRGIDGVLEEVTRSLQIFLAYRSFREELGGNPRRGILFEGPPGTGKTHLAKAMASEARVPFFFVSAPAFQSMFFGMTAFKIRSYFRSLKKAARKEGGAIGFIEEIDAVGAARSGMSMSPNPSAARTISQIVDSGSGGMVNELLIQLQSFDTPPLGQRIANKLKDLLNMLLPAAKQLKRGQGQYNNVLIIAATNRADTLDPALLRPGRFDRILHFDLPSKAGRRELIDYFLIKRSHGEEMDSDERRDEFASMTLGYTPAMLEHVLDEALVWALRDGRRALEWTDLQRARLSEEIGIGQPVAYTDRERALIATHEAGHAVIAYLCAKDRRLEVLSIIKRRSALGLLAHSDIEERFTRTKSELESTLRVSLGGMAAEELFFGESGTGPASDLQAATALTAQMVGALGMGSSLVSLDAADHGGAGGPNLVAKVLSNDDARREVDQMIRSHKSDVLHLLNDNRDLVEALRDELLEREELLGDEILTVLEKAEAARN